MLKLFVHRLFIQGGCLNLCFRGHCDHSFRVLLQNLFIFYLSLMGLGLTGNTTTLWHSLNQELHTSHNPLWICLDFTHHRNLLRIFGTSHGPEYLWPGHIRFHDPPQRGCRVARQLLDLWGSTPQVLSHFYQNGSGSKDTRSQRNRDDFWFVCVISELWLYKHPDMRNWTVTQNLRRDSTAWTVFPALDDHSVLKMLIHKTGLLLSSDEYIFLALSTSIKNHVCKSVQTCCPGPNSLHNSQLWQMGKSVSSAGHTGIPPERQKLLLKLLLASDFLLLALNVQQTHLCDELLLGVVCVFPQLGWGEDPVSFGPFQCLRSCLPCLSTYHLRH